MSEKTLRVIAIDPFKEEVRYETIRDPKFDGNYSLFNEEMYKLLSKGPIKVDIMEAVRLNTPKATANDCILVDEEGLLHNTDEQKFFFIKDVLYQPLAGIGIVTGADDGSDTIEPSISLDWFKQHVSFLTPADIRRIARPI